MKRKYLPIEFERYIKAHNFSCCIWNTEEQVGTGAYDFNHINMYLAFDSIRLFYLPTCVVLSDSNSSNKIVIHNFEYAFHELSSSFGELFELFYKASFDDDRLLSIKIVLKLF